MTDEHRHNAFSSGNADNTATSSAPYGLLAPGELARLFNSPSARKLHSGRNLIKAVPAPDGTEVVVKLFARPTLLRRIKGLLCGDKATQSQRNARRLLNLGINTPMPMGIGKIDGRRYYACAMCNGRPLKDFCTPEDANDSVSVLAEFARFVRKLHSNGIIHKDLNSTNVLVETHADSDMPLFQLIDINRMSFTKRPISLEKRLENLTLFSMNDENFHTVLRQYLMEGNEYSPATYALGLQLKMRHDRRWVARKAFSQKIKSLFHKK